MANHVVGTMGGPGVTLQKLEGLAWGLFFVWIGIAPLANLGWGVTVLGIGILILGAQMARKYIAQGLETFWLLVGTFFVLGGVWMLLGIQVSLIPIFCILVGLVLLVSALIVKARA